MTISIEGQNGHTCSSSGGVKCSEITTKREIVANQAKRLITYLNLFRTLKHTSGRKKIGEFGRKVNGDDVK